MPGKGKYRSIKKPRTYRALRRKGYPKSKAAAISNAQAAGTINYSRRRSRRRTLRRRRR